MTRRPNCREMQTRQCPWRDGCLPKTCARFGSDDPTPWLPPEPPLKLRPTDPPPEAA